MFIKKLYYIIIFICIAIIILCSYDYESFKVIPLDTCKLECGVINDIIVPCPPPPCEKQVAECPCS